jgi:hypothetical protein
MPAWGPKGSGKVLSQLPPYVTPSALTSDALGNSRSTPNAGSTDGAVGHGGGEQRPQVSGPREVVLGSGMSP